MSNYTTELLNLTETHYAVVIAAYDEYSAAVAEAQRAHDDATDSNAASLDDWLEMNPKSDLGEYDRVFDRYNESRHEIDKQLDDAVKKAHAAFCTAVDAADETYTKGKALAQERWPASYDPS